MAGKPKKQSAREERIRRDAPCYALPDANFLSHAWGANRRAEMLDGRAQLVEDCTLCGRTRAVP
jgi:hypothetical protein